MSRAKPFFRGEKSRFTTRNPSEGGSSSTTITKPNQTIPPVKKISWEEMQKRREKGLCFSCNERFTPGHRCAIKQLFVFDAENGGDYDGMGDKPALEQIEEEASDVEPQIFLHALTGYTGPRTMRVAGRIGCRKVLVLIDNGSTHNFIDQRLAWHLGLSVTPIDQFWVTVANGEKLCCREKHEGVKLLIQGLDMLVTFYSLPLNGLDAVLGIHWLEKLGPVICDWGRLFMTLTRGDKVYEIVVQCKICGQAINNTMLGRQVSSGGEVFAVAVRQDKTESHSSVADEI
jgi:hypothetical protein